MNSLSTAVAVEMIAATLRARLAMGLPCDNAALLSIGYTAEQLAEAADKAREIVRQEVGK